MPVLEALGELARGPAGETRRRDARPARADVARRAAVAARRRPGRPRRSATARRAPRARGCCARCSRRSTRSAPRRRVRAGARGPALGRRLDARPARRAAAPARAGAAARRSAPTAPARASRRSPRSSTTSACAACARSCRSRGSAPTRSPPYLAGALPGGADCPPASPPCCRAHRRQPAVHAQPARPLAGRRDARRGGGAVRLTARGRARGRRAADAARAHPRPARRAARRRRRGAARRERRRAASSPPTRSPPRSTATARRVEARCAALAAAARALIERRDGGHGFPHDLHREVLYELLPPTRGRGCTRASARTWPTRYGPAAARAGRRARRSTSSPGATPSARCASCASRPSGRSGATPTPRASATCAPRSTPPRALRRRARSARAREVELLSLARPGARGDRRLVGAGGRGRAAARPRRSPRGCRTTSRSSPSCSRWRRCTSCAASSRARQDDGRGVPAARARAASDEHAPGVDRAARLQPVPPGLVRARARARRARRRAVRGAARRRRLLDLPGDARRQRGRLLPRLGGPGAVVPRPPGRGARARDARARAGARPEPRLQPRHRARADGGRAPVPARAGGGAASGRRRRSRRRSSSATSTARRWGGCCAAGRSRCSATATQGVAEIDGGPGGVARDRRAHGRPALPRPARRGAPARGRRRGRRWRRSREALELARRERSLFYEPSCTACDGALHAVGGDAAAAEASLRAALARAREQGSRDARAADRDRPRAARWPSGRARPRRAPLVAAVLRALHRGLRDAATCARPPRCSRPIRLTTP